MNLTKNLLINKTASALSEKNYILLLRLMSLVLRLLGYDSIKKLQQISISLDSVGTFKATKVTLFSGKQFMVTDPIRANRLLKGLDHAGERLLHRYEMSHRKGFSTCTIFVDVGANVGELSRLMSARVKMVIAIEPDPIARHCLEFNLQEVANVVVIPCALGEKKGTAPLFLLPSSADSSLFYSQGVDAPLIDVMVVRGDDLLLNLLDSDDVLVIKMDAEGFEPEVLRGMQQLLLRATLICIDSGQERGGAATANDCVHLLKQVDMQVSLTKHLMTIGERVT